MRARAGRNGRAAIACVAAAVLTLSACGSDVNLPDITLPDVTLPDVTAPDITLPQITPPDITLPTFPGGGDETTPPTATATGTAAPTVTEPPTGTEPATVTVTTTETATGAPPASTGGGTVTVTVTPPATETAAAPTETEAATETAPATPDEAAEDEGGGVPWWVWLLVALALLGLAGWLLARRSAAHRARHAWTERVDAAVERMNQPQNVLRRPATLVPADQEAVRRAVAELRDLSMTLSELASTAPDEVLGHLTADTGDALRALATAGEIENEGLAAGRLVTFEHRQDAEARRLTALRDVDDAVERLMTRLAA